MVQVDQFVEKPKPEDAPSNLGVIGRYVITPDIIPLLQKTSKAIKDKEVRLADAFISALKKEIPIYAAQIDGKRYDTGSKLGFIIASIELGLQHPEINGPLNAYLKKMCRR